VTEALDRILGSGPSAWTRLGRGVQLLILSAALLVPLVFFGAQWMSEGQYVPLFNSLPPEEGGAILAQLKASKTPYRIGGAGDQILVPADKVSEARLRLAMQGLPVGGGVGFEVFDRPSLGVSDFAQRLNYQRALQGELARTIGQLREVARARVHLVLPQPSLFTDRDRPASASVFVKLAPGAQLGKEQVKGIVHLVASSVEGLSPERVTLVDTAGRVLSTGADAAGSPLSGKRLEVKSALEEGLERRVQTLLDSALGAGQAITRVSAQVNFDQMERTEEKFDPNALTTPGEIKRLSVAVGVNARSAPAAAAGADPKAAPAAPVPRTPEELDKIKQVVMTAVGFSEPRGDSVTVTEMPFDTTALDRERALLDQPAPAPKGKIVTLSMPMIAAAAGTAVLVLVLLVWLGMRGRTRARARAEVALSLERVPEAAVLAREAAVAAGLPASAGPAVAAAVAAAVPAGSGASGPPAAGTALSRAIAAAKAQRTSQPIVAEEELQLTREREDIREKAFAMASSEPDATAQLLRAWLVKKKTPPMMTSGASHGA
jgi:flagellar biosynthesis/type III secretory pathway M-ring protein FliF/YscJ